MKVRRRIVRMRIIKRHCWKRAMRESKQEMKGNKFEDGFFDRFLRYFSNFFDNH